MSLLALTYGRTVLRVNGLTLLTLTLTLNMPPSELLFTSTCF